MTITKAVVGLFILLAVVFVGALGYMLNQPLAAPTDGPEAAGDTSVLPTAKPVETAQSSPASNMATYQGNGFKFAYATDTFVAVEASNTLPPAYKAKYRGIKLISHWAANRIASKLECEYGQSGKMVPCTPEMQVGISFYKADKAAPAIVAELDDYAGKTTMTLLGKQVVRWSIGAEGEGADYYFIPLAQDQTLVVVRTYNVKGYPSQALFDQVISTLTFQ